MVLRHHVAAVHAMMLIHSCINGTRLRRHVTLHRITHVPGVILIGTKFVLRHEYVCLVRHRSTVVGVHGETVVRLHVEAVILTSAIDAVVAVIGLLVGKTLVEGRF